MRRLTIVLIILAVLLGLFFLFTTFKKTPAPTSDVVEQTPESSSVTLMDPTPAEVLEPRLSLVTSEEVVDYWVNQLDRQVYYVTSEGAVKRADKIGNPTVISSSRFEGGVSTAISSSRGDAVIISSLGRPNADFKLFDVERSIWRSLPIGTTAAAWSPSSPTNEVVFLKTVLDKTSSRTVSSLNIYSLLKGTSRQLIELSQYDLLLDWITPSTVALSQKPAAGTTGSVWLYDIQKKTLRTLLTGREGLWTKWQPLGAVAFDFTNGAYLLNTKGSVSRLPFFSLPDKCTQEGMRLYCAEPIDGLDEVGMPDSYLQKKVMSDDNFLSVSLSELPRFPFPVKVFENEKGGSAIDAWHLTKSGPNLYFINRYDQKVYSLQVLTD
jgi:hypothetical protein